MSSMMLRTGPLYFYDQLKTKTIKRTKKVPEELPSDMKYMNINPRLANFINSINKNKKGVSAHAEKKQATSLKEDKLRKEKYAVLPEISGSSLLKSSVENHNQKIGQVITDDEQFMNPFDDYKYVAPTLLYELGKLLHFFSRYEIIFPQGVVNVLNYSWQELIEGAVYTKKPWQSLASKKIPDTSVVPEESDYKASGAGAATLENVDTIKNNKNKANATLLESGKEKAGQELAHTRPTGNKCEYELSSPSNTSIAAPQSFATHLPVTISFSMSSRVCEDRGWIFQTNDSKSEDMEWKGLIAWALERLQLAQMQINKQLLLLNEKGFCKPVILRHYENTKKDPLIKPKKNSKIPVFVLMNGKPHIPEIKRENASLRKLHYALIDGSAMVYNVFVLHYNQFGGVVTDKEGEKIKEWDWPKKRKLSDAITLQVNEYLSIKIAGQFAISLIYRWQHETVRLTLSPLLDVPPPQIEDLGQLMTSENFSSRTAREMSKANRKKAKEKDTKRIPKKTTILSELAKTLVIPEDHISPSNDFNAATELRKLQRKIQNIMDDWMEHYRLASGLDSPHIQKMSDAPPKTSRKRKVQSAAVIPALALQAQPVTETDVEGSPSKESLLHGRFLSAPAHPHNMRWDTLSSASPRPSSFSSMRKEHIAADTNLSKNVSGPNVMDKSGTQAAQLAALSPLEEDPEKLWHMSHYTCPVVFQKVLLGEEGSICRCSSHQIPYVTDLEFDQLINNKSSSPEQIIVVCVVSSLGSEEDHSKDVLDHLYEKKNRYRSMPCMQSRLDSFRLFKYDINTCNMFAGDKDPLLVRRHNAAPGMILMYTCGKLMFANYIFNGYSRSIKDLQKQIVKTRSDYQTGYHLPSDFKFSYEGHPNYSSFKTSQTRKDNTVFEQVSPRMLY